MHSSRSFEGSQPDPVVERAHGLVLACCLDPHRRSRLSPTALDRIRGLARGDGRHLETSFSDLGVDSLEWMSMLTDLEESLDILLADDDVTSPRGHSPWGLAQIVASALSRSATGLPPADPTINDRVEETP